MGENLRAIAAIDLGATSGRVILAIVGSNSLEMIETARFPNRPRTVDGTLCWDIEGLWNGILDGLSKAASICQSKELTLESIGVDSWAVDYVLVDQITGEPLGEAVCYRDSRTNGARENFSRKVPLSQQYSITGIAAQPFNTIYQLSVDHRLSDKAKALLIPDYIAYKLTGQIRSELTNLSTTGLLSHETGKLSSELMGSLGLTENLFSPPILPGQSYGYLTDELSKTLGINTAQVVAVGSHDTASAVYAVPAASESFAYISSGTWSLLGLELDQPIINEEARHEGFTNERGVEGDTRFLKNISGMWLLSQSIEQWEQEGHAVDLPQLIKACAHLPEGVTFDVEDSQFIHPGNMADRVREAMMMNGAQENLSIEDITRGILDSLAESYIRNLRKALELAHQPSVDALHIIGGGSQNELLCQLTANRLDMTVVAGPVEATALGNIVVQAQALGIVEPGKAKARSFIRAVTTTKTYAPNN